MVARSKTGTFVTEIELRPTGKQSKQMRARFQAVRQVYNACLGETLRRLDLMRESKDWQRARKLEKEQKGSGKTLFRETQKRFKFNEYDLHHWSTRFTKSWINEHLGARTVEATASSAFKSCETHLYMKRGRPRFRRSYDLRAVDGKTHSDVRWKGDHIKWKKLNISLGSNLDDPVIAHGLSVIEENGQRRSRVKYVRLVRRVIRGKERCLCSTCLRRRAVPQRVTSPHSGSGWP